MLHWITSKIGKKLGLILDALAFVATSGGAILGAMRGKVPVALFLCVCACAFFLRVTSRGRNVSKQQHAPAWVVVSNAILSILATGLLVEATNLPVRYTQVGFAYWHWALVLVALLASFALFSQVYGRVTRKEN
jgi:drug/metabolite transporter (DMT)-like permease